MEMEKIKLENVRLNEALEEINVLIQNEFSIRSELRDKIQGIVSAKCLRETRSGTAGELLGIAIREMAELMYNELTKERFFEGLKKGLSNETN